MNVNKDTYDVKAVSLADVAAMCHDCVTLCRQRTSRLITNNSNAPKGFEDLYSNLARGRVREEQTKCENECGLVRESCPTVLEISYYDERSALRAAQRAELAKKPNAKPSRPALADETVEFQQSIDRCEHAAERFTQYLFALAHKPTKVHFEAVDARSGKGIPTTVEGAAATTKPVTQTSRFEELSKSAKEEIRRRWSGKAYRPPREGEAPAEGAPQDLANLDAATMDRYERHRRLIEEQQRQGERPTDGTSGTKPKW